MKDTGPVSLPTPPFKSRRERRQAQRSLQELQQQELRQPVKGSFKEAQQKRDQPLQQLLQVPQSMQVPQAPKQDAWLSQPELFDHVLKPDVEKIEQINPVALSVQEPALVDIAANGTATKKKYLDLATLMSGAAELLLTVGFILALFVVWQLYVTTWEVQGATAATIESFKRANAGAATEVAQTQRTDPPPVTDMGVQGHAFATLHVPRWDQMVIPIEQGTTARVLDTGYAGHYVQTQGPGELGNFAIAAHRRSYGNSFRRVEELEQGDPLIVETSQAWMVYVVDATEIVLPTNGGPILSVPHHPEASPSERIMTMTTCHPEYGNSERFIVYSKLAYWVPRGEGRPAALSGKV